MPFTSEDRGKLFQSMSTLIKEKITDEANFALGRAVEQAADYLSGTGYLIQEYLEKNIEQVSTTRGLMDNWLVLVSLTSLQPHCSHISNLQKISIATNYRGNLTFRQLFPFLCTT